MQNSVVICTCFSFPPEFPFCLVNIVQKIKIVSLGWNLLPGLPRICRIQWWYSLFCFRLETPFLSKFGPKNQNCQFKPKFGSYINSNMPNSMVVFTFSVLDWKQHFWANLVQRIKIVSSSWNLATRLIPICRIEWWCLLFLF